MEFFGIELDRDANKHFVGVDGLISKTNGKVKVLSVTTNEEMVIALDTYRLVH